MASWKDYSRIVAEAKASKKLDPVGQEDNDVDNDGDSDSSDSYLKKRRESVGAAIAADKKKKSMIKVAVPEKKLGYKVADIGPGGKEHNVKTYGAYKEALDPVGQEDEDIDNDGKKNTKSDKYLRNRRKVRSKVIEGASTKVDMDGPKVGCNDPDPRGMKTQANLIKTKLRLMGLRPLMMSNESEGDQLDEFFGPDKVVPKGGQISGSKAPVEVGRDYVAQSGGRPTVVNYDKAGSRTVRPFNQQDNLNRRKNALSQNAAAASMGSSPLYNVKNSYEPEGGQIDEIAPLIAGGLALGGALAAGAAIKRSQDAAKSGVDAANKGKQIKNPGTGIAGAAYGMQKRNNDLNDAMKQLRQSYEPEGSLIEGKKKDSSYLETDMKKRRENNEKAVEDMKKTKAHADMVKSARRAMGVDEEFSLVDRMIAEFSPLNEAPQNTIPGGQRRKGLSKTIQNKEVDKAAESGDYERADKLQDSATIRVKKKSKKITTPEEEPTSPTPTTKKPSAGKTTAYERATRTSAAGRIRAARIARQTEREKREYKEKVRQETKSEKAADKEERLKSSAEKQKKLEAKDKERRVDQAGRSAEQEFDKKQEKKKALRDDIKKATQVKSPPVVSSRESDGKSIGSVTSSALEVGAVPFKLLGVGIKHALNKRKENQRTEAGNRAREKALKDASKDTPKEVKESFSNWREDFILEVDNQDVNPNKKKIIDVSKVKNNIEINPNITEALPLLALAGRLVGGRVATGIAARGATIAAQGGLRKKAVEFAAKKGGEMASSAIENSATPVETPGQSDDIKNKVSSGAEGLMSFLMPKLKEDAAWTRKEGKNKSGGLNEKGRKSYESDNPGSDLKAPSKTVGNPRRKSFCARMSGMKSKLTSAKTARDPDSRINKSLRAWNC